MRTGLTGGQDLLRMRGVDQGYGTRRVLSDLDLTLGAGITALLGPNGAGKSTLLKTICTLLPLRSGTLEILGEPVTDASAIRTARNRIGYLEQGFRGDPQFTVRDFVTYAAWLREVPRERLEEHVAAALLSVGLQEHARTRMKALSGGMRQRAGIAAACVAAPPLLVLDEPTVGLDPQQRVEFRGYISALDGSCIILSTHLIEDVRALADRVIVLDAGRIRFDGTVAQLGEAAPVPTESEGVTALEAAYLALLTPTPAA